MCQIPITGERIPTPDNCNNKGTHWSKQLQGPRVMLSLGIKRFEVYYILRALSSFPCQFPVLPICLDQIFLQYGSPHDTRTGGNGAKERRVDLCSSSLSRSSLCLIQLMSWIIFHWFKPFRAHPRISQIRSIPCLPSGWFLKGKLRWGKKENGG